MKKVVDRKFRAQKKSRFQIDPATLVLVKQVFIGISLFSLVGLVLVGIWYGTRIPALTISEVRVADGPTIRGAVVEKAIEEVLEGEYLRLIPRRFTFLYPEKEILERLVQVERIKDVKLDKVSMTGINVSFSEYKPHALWCGYENDLCYFIDENGFAFGIAPTLTGASLVRYYKSDKEPQLRTSYIETEDFEKTKQFVEMVAQAGWYIEKVEVDSVRDVFYTLVEESELRVTLRDEVEEPITYLEALLGSSEFSHLKPGNFQYVDLRFGSKLYVNEEKKDFIADNKEDGLPKIKNTDMEFTVVATSAPSGDFEDSTVGISEAGEGEVGVLIIGDMSEENVNVGTTEDEGESEDLERDI